MNKFNDMFPHIFLINMDIHKERLDLASKELGKFDIAFERFPGILHNGGIHIKDRSMGNTLSHRRILEKAIDNNWSTVVIFEDDIELRDDFMDFIPNIKNFIDNNEYHLFYLGANYNTFPTKHVSNGIRKAYNCWTTHAYIISQLGCRAFLNEMKPGRYVVDKILYNHVQPFGKCYGSNPNIAFQRDGFSYTVGKDVNYSKALKD